MSTAWNTARQVGKREWARRAIEDALNRGETVVIYSHDADGNVITETRGPGVAKDVTPKVKGLPKP